jgi:hypothetical protein
MQCYLFRVFGDSAEEWMRCELSCGQLFVDELDVESPDAMFRFVLASSARVAMDDAQISLDVALGDQVCLGREGVRAWIRRPAWVARGEVDLAMLEAISGHAVQSPIALSIPPIQPRVVNYHTSAAERLEMAAEFARTPMEDQLHYLMHTLHVPIEAANAPVAVVDGNLLATAPLPAGTIVAAVAPDVVILFADTTSVELTDLAPVGYLETRSTVSPQTCAEVARLRRVPLTPYVHICPVSDPPHPTMLGYAVQRGTGVPNVVLECLGPSAYFRTSADVPEGAWLVSS